jgi:hypothetical protein
VSEWVQEKAALENRIMTVAETQARVLDELAAFLASGPSREELLAFRFSEQTRQRAHELLDKLRDGHLTEEEERELDQFEQADLLMQLVAARIHAARVRHP